MNNEQFDPPRDSGTRIRPHSYDGIQEYDQRLPNWWLWTFYVAIIFSVYYWFSWYQADVTSDDAARLETELDRIEAVKLADSLDVLDNGNLWKMSRNAEFVSAGSEIYASTCVSCHGRNLEGGIGKNLVDDEWTHGGNPVDVFNTVTNGVVAKGMQAWGSLLGSKKIAEVVAFILSHHEPPASPPDAQDPRNDADRDGA